MQTWNGAALLITLLSASLLWNSCSEDASVPEPTNIVAVPGNGLAIVSWQFAAIAIRDSAKYNVTYSKIGGNENCALDAGQGDTNCVYSISGHSSIMKISGSDLISQIDTVYGLTNGISYAFTVEGFTSYGEYGVSYGKSNPVTPLASDTAKAP